MKKVIGWSLIASPFLGIAIFIFKTLGFMPMVIIFSSVFAVVLMFIFGVFLTER